MGPRSLGWHMNLGMDCIHQRHHSPCNSDLLRKYEPGELLVSGALFFYENVRLKRFFVFWFSREEKTASSIHLCIANCTQAGRISLYHSNIWLWLELSPNKIEVTSQMVMKITCTLKRNASRWKAFNSWRGWQMKKSKKMILELYFKVLKRWMRGVTISHCVTMMKASVLFA